MKKEKQTNNKDTANLEQQVEDLTNQLKRALADYNNLKTRVEREKQEFTLMANMVLLSSVLDVMDDFDLAIDKYTKTEADEVDWLKGITMIRGKMSTVLGNQNVTEIETLENGEFDPELHEAVGTVMVTEKDNDGKIVGIVRKGYKVEDRVIRPTRVVVGKLQE